MHRGAWAMMAFATLIVPAAGQASNTLLLELWINGATRHAVVAVTMEGAALKARADDLRRAGLVLPAETPAVVDLRALPGATAKIDMPGQLLLLTVASRALAGEVYDLQPAPERPQASSLTGATLHYDLSAATDDATRFGRSASGGANLALDLFSQSGLFRVSGFARTAASGGMAVRLDTAFEIDDPEGPSRLVLGDAVSGAVSWSRAVRFAGVQYASDFSLRPDLVTQPLPAFFGEAAVPTTVEVFAGAVRVFEQDVAPGPFEIRNLPVVTGGGTASIVTRDVLGRQTTQSLSLYTTTDLLAPGLTSFAFDLGLLRKDYGVASFGYSTPIASAIVRRGLAGGWTVEAHGEAAPRQALAGVGLARSLGAFGAFSLDGAVSTGGAGTGWLGAATLEGGSGIFHVFGSLAAASASYRDLASLDGTPPARLRWQLGASASFREAGSLSLSWIGDRTWRGTAAQYLSASYSVSLPGELFLGLTGLRDVGAGKWSAQLFLTVPFGGGYASGTLSAAPDGNSALLSYDRPVDPDGGVGYRVMAQAGDDTRAGAEIAWLGDHGRL
ncbi:MAG TPA: fimbria/pilus outer membrane usher protein, partial [Rhizomicrobium sp.]